MPSVKHHEHDPNSFIILSVLPEATGIVMTGPLLATTFLGEEFRPLTVSLLPLLAEPRRLA